MIDAAGFTRLLLGAALLVQLGGCGMFRDKSEDYKRAEETPVLELPTGISARPMEELYPIPPVRSTLLPPGEFEVPRPTPLTAGAVEQKVRIQKLGDDSWALVEEAPGQLWPQVRAFLNSAGISVARLDARGGLIDTDWLELKSASIPSRFRLRIDQGVQRGTSELYVLQQNKAGDIEDWPQVSDNPDQEAEMLSSLAQFIADSAGNAPVSMVAEQAIRSEGRVSLEQDEQETPYILLLLPYDRAWASVSLALQKSGFEITDRNRSEGFYYLRYTGPEGEEKSGWFDWLWKEDDGLPDPGDEFIVQVKQRPGGGGESIYLRPQQGQEELDETQLQTLLTLIKGNIS